MPKKKTTEALDRIVYNVRHHGDQQTRVEAGDVKSLKAALLPLLGLDPYSVQAIAHLAHRERAQVEGSGWSVTRAGVLRFVPDSPVTAQKGPQKAEQVSEQSLTPDNQSQAVLEANQSQERAFPPETEDPTPSLRTPNHVPPADL